MNISFKVYGATDESKVSRRIKDDLTTAFAGVGMRINIG